jgi:NADH:ubiquinone reductase (H+-translocating)
MPDGRAKVVTVGAGFGGIEAAESLRRAPVEVTVIDRQNHHCFQSLLYQVATAALSPADIAWPIHHILAQQVFGAASPCFVKPPPINLTISSLP